MAEAPVQIPKKSSSHKSKGESVKPPTSPRVAPREPRGKAKAASPHKSRNKSEAPPSEDASKKRKSVLQVFVELKK